jgi:hypothetical protein
VSHWSVFGYSLVSVPKLLKVVALEEAGVDRVEVVEGRQALSAIGAERHVIHSQTLPLSKR